MKRMLRLIIVVCFCIIGIESEALPLRGFSTNAFLYDFPKQQFNAAYVKEVQVLQPEILRFPGGTIANKYHFLKSGYGQNSVYDQKIQFNYIEELIRLVKSLSPQPKVLYVVNIFEHFQGGDDDWALLVENLAAISYLQKSGVEVYGVELGNELMIYQAFQDWQTGWMQKMSGWKTTDKGWYMGPKAYRYYTLCRIYDKAIEKLNPAIKIGIPLGSNYNKKHKPWNAAVQQFDFADAFIYHFYGNTEKQENEVLAAEAIDEYLKRASKQIVGTQVLTGKKIWITEWNGINFGFRSNQNVQWKQTVFHQRCNEKFQTLFNDLDVEVSTYHRISGSKEGDTYNLINVKNGKVTLTPNFEQFTRPPFKNADTLTVQTQL
jgi:hypothetical protein